MPIAVAAAASAVATSEKVVITTDVVKATLDSAGGSLVRLELTKNADVTDPTKPLVLFDQSAARVYVAQTGLFTSQPGVNLPNHLTAMKLQPGERVLKDGDLIKIGRTIFKYLAGTNIEASYHEEIYRPTR